MSALCEFRMSFRTVRVVTTCVLFIWVGMMPACGGKTPIITRDGLRAIPFRVNGKGQGIVVCIVLNRDLRPVEGVLVQARTSSGLRSGQTGDDGTAVAGNDGDVSDTWVNGKFVGDIGHNNRLVVVME